MAKRETILNTMRTNTELAKRLIGEMRELKVQLAKGWIDRTFFKYEFSRKRDEMLKRRKLDGDLKGLLKRL